MPNGGSVTIRSIEASGSERMSVTYDSLTTALRSAGVVFRLLDRVAPLFPDDEQMVRDEYRALCNVVWRRLRIKAIAQTRHGTAGEHLPGGELLHPTYRTTHRRSDGLHHLFERGHAKIRHLRRLHGHLARYVIVLARHAPTPFQ